MTAVSSRAAENLREQIAGNVRAELSRRNVRVNHLPARTGRHSQSYWSRRVNGELPFTTDDLGLIADLLSVDLRRFLEVEDSHRPAGSIYFHGNESSHIGAA